MIFCGILPIYSYFIMFIGVNMFKGLRRKAIKEKRKGKFIVGVCSTHPNAGATHFSMLLATYLSEWLGLKTAYIDFEDKAGLCNLEYYFLKNKEPKESYFTVGRVTFYNYENLYRLSEIIGGDTDCVILDMGHHILENMNEFIRSDIKVVLSSLAVWKQDKLHYFLETVNNTYPGTEWKYVIPFVNEKAMKEAGAFYNVDLYQMPYEPDPFMINAAVIRFFNRVLQK